MADNQLCAHLIGWGLTPWNVLRVFGEKSNLCVTGLGRFLSYWCILKFNLLQAEPNRSEGKANSYPHPCRLPASTLGRQGFWSPQPSDSQTYTISPNSQALDFWWGVNIFLFPWPLAWNWIIPLNLQSICLTNDTPWDLLACEPVSKIDLSLSMHI